MVKRASKAQAAKTPAAKKPMEAKFPDPTEKDKADALARMALKPSVNAALVLTEYTKPMGQQDLGALMAALSAGMEDVWAGDMKRPEAMLYGQAHALQAIFMSLARRATTQDYLKQWEAYLRMALKAQNQCRMTLETLATIKNPPTVFARQANINNGGQQQVNNGAATGVERHPEPHAPAREMQTGQTELLEATHGQRLDTRAASAAGGADPHLEAVGTVYGPTNEARQGPGSTQR